MAGAAKRSGAKAPSTLGRRIRLLRGDVEFAAQSFHCWERYLHHWDDPHVVEALNRLEAQIWFRASEWSTLHTTLMALGRLYGQTRGDVHFEGVAAELLRQRPDPRAAAEWEAMMAAADPLVRKLRAIRNEAIAHRRDPPKAVFGRVRLFLPELDALVEHAKEQIRWIERRAGLTPIPFHDRATVFKSVDAVFRALLERAARDKDAWVELPEQYPFIRRLIEHPAVTRLIVFGSWARREQRASSDIDLAVACSPETPATRYEIEAIVEGADTLRKVDLVWLEDLSPDDPLLAAIRRDGRPLKGEALT